jgi:hypothetical protein
LFDRATGLSPAFAPGWEHLAFLATAEGDSAIAERALGQWAAAMRGPPRDTFSFALRAMVTSAYGWRFQPGGYAELVTRQALLRPTAPIFEQWMEPFRNLGMTTLTIRNTGGTDHLAFDAVGLPGFQFIQDPVEYGTRTHHSNMDVYERIQPFDMMQNAVIVAAFVYQTANREEKLPRKPLPKAAAPARASSSR